MNRLLFIFLISASVCLGQYRDFTNKEGVKVSAKLIDKTKDSVKIELKDKRVFDIKIDTLSDEDRKFISDWWKPEFKTKIHEDLGYSQIPKGTDVKGKLKGYRIDIEQATVKKGYYYPQKVAYMRADTLDIFKAELSKIPAIIQRVQEKNVRDFHLPIEKKIDRRETLYWSVEWGKNEEYPMAKLGDIPINEQELLALIKFLDSFDVIKEVGAIEDIKNNLIK